MKTFMCKSPLQAYHTALNKHTTIHTGACFVSETDGVANEQGMLLLHGITADDDKKVWIHQPVFQEYFEETATPAEYQSQLPAFHKTQTMLEALYG